MIVIDFLAGFAAFTFTAAAVVLLFELSRSVAPRNRRHLP